MAKKKLNRLNSILLATNICFMAVLGVFVYQEKKAQASYESKLADLEAWQAALAANAEKEAMENGTASSEASQIDVPDVDTASVSAGKVTVTYPDNFLSVDNLTEKQATIQGKKLYASGDSVMVGAGNNNWGLADTLSEDGGQIICDTSVSGTCLCSVFDETLPCGISTAQLESLYGAVTENGYDENTIVLLDGSGNDLRVYLQEIMGLSDTTYGISIVNGEDESKDIQKALRSYLSKVCYIFGNMSAEQNYTVPIFFVIPRMSGFLDPANPGAGGEMLSSRLQIWRDTLRSVCAEYEQYGVICIDEFDFLTAEEDLADSVHPNSSGYQKLKLAIENTMYLNADAFRNNNTAAYTAQ